MTEQTEHQYVLIRPLGGNGEREVFLAKDADGEDVVLKLWANDGMFFDELAKHFGLDGSRYICKLLQHLPPGSISADMIQLDPGLGWDDQKKMLFFNSLPQKGALVLEHINGRALIHVLEETPDRQKFPYLLELCQALLEIHACDEFHGDISRENVILDASTGRVRVLDLGFFHGKKDTPLEELSPEHNPYWTRKVEKGSDIYMFAKNYLGTVTKPSTKLSKLYRACLNPDPKTRPSLEELQTKLSQPEYQVQSEPQKQSGFFARGPLRWATLAYFLAASTVGIALVTDTELFDQREAAMEIARTNPDQAIDELLETRKALYNISDYQLRINREMAIARDIASTRRQTADFRVKKFADGDLEQPIGVFAFPEGAAMVGKNQIYEIGDWVEHNGRQAFISRITPVQVTLEFAGNIEQILFEAPDFYVPPVLYDYGVILWENDNNLARVLDVLPKLNRSIFGEALPREDTILNQLMQRSTASVEAVEGEIAGVFSVFDFNAYAKQLKDLLVFRHEGPTLNVSVAAERVPIHFRYETFRTNGRKLGEFASDLSYYLGIEFQFADGLADRTLPEIETANATWQELCQQLGIVWEKRASDDQTVIFVQSLNKGA
ncbi:serine/threonine-protein kinase [Acanthopleuribacter pedis]|uniref:Serine/threonine protein kinase n=1 Tax=Acanthopleuribacter pedis TaxID=442870 RepID=A0A8J7QHX9_9BACT|nr:serine/threonine-protein kinase [Acanthopleuribacter pedis]MBO1320630.1 serine/threonine protein kinase [Acanthopleuribacter pedis]